MCCSHQHINTSCSKHTSYATDICFLQSHWIVGLYLNAMLIAWRVRCGRAPVCAKLRTVTSRMLRRRGHPLLFVVQVITGIPRIRLHGSAGNLCCVIAAAHLVFPIQCCTLCVITTSLRAFPMQCCASFLDVVTDCNVPVEARASNHGPQQEELRANHNGKTKTVPRGTFSGWGPIRRRMGWVLAANRVRHSIGAVLSCQSGPRLIMIIT
jgi:hypothetical protein